MIEFAVATNVDSGTGKATPTTVIGTDSIPRLYLPGEAELGSGIDWDYSYDLILNMPDMGGTFTVPTEGIYVELGWTTKRVPAGEFDCYLLSNTYTQDWSQVYTTGGTTVTEAYAEYCYAEGIGLVWENTQDTVTGGTIMQKSLRTVSGLP
jgi:hypothetical protein